MTRLPSQVMRPRSMAFCSSRMFPGLLVPASVLITVGVTVFILADLRRMSAVRSIAMSVIAAACLLTLAAAG